MERVCLVASDEEDEDGNLSHLEPRKAVMPEVIYFSENPSCFQPEEEEITDRLIPVVHRQEPTVYVAPNSSKAIPYIKSEVQEISHSTGYGELGREAGRGIKREASEEIPNTFMSKTIKIENSNEIESMDPIDHSTVQTKRERKILPKPEAGGIPEIVPKLTTLVKVEQKSILHELVKPKLNDQKLKSNTTTFSKVVKESHTDTNKTINQRSCEASSSTTINNKRPETATTTFNAKKIKYDRQATPICDAIMKEYSRRQKLLKMQGSKASPDLSDMPIQEILNKAKHNQDQNKTLNVSGPKTVIATSNRKEPAEKQKDSLDLEQKDPLAIVPKVEIDVKPNIASINVDNSQTSEALKPQTVNAIENQTRRGRGRPRRRYSEDDPPYKPGIKVASSKSVNKIVKQPIITAQNRLESPKCDAIMKEYSRRQKELKMQRNKANTNISNMPIQDMLNKTSGEQSSKTTADEFKTRTVSITDSSSNRQEPSLSEDKDPLGLKSVDEVVSNNVEKSQTPIPSPENNTEHRELPQRKRRGRPRVRYPDNEPSYKSGSTSPQRSNKIVKPSTLQSKNKLDSIDSFDKSSELKVDTQKQDAVRGKRRSGKYYEDPPYKIPVNSKKTVNVESSTSQNKPGSKKRNLGITSELQVLLTPLEKDGKVDQNTLREGKNIIKNFDNQTSELNLYTNQKRTARKSFPSSTNKSQMYLLNTVNRLKSQLQSIASEKNLDIKNSASSSSNKNIESVGSNVNISKPEALSYATRLKSMAEKIAEKILSNESSPDIENEAKTLLQTTQELLKLQKEPSNSISVNPVSIDKQIKQELPDEISQASSFDNFGLPITSASNYIQNNQHGNPSIVTGTISVTDKCTFVMDYFTSFKEVFHPQIYQTVIPVMAEILMLCMDDLQECLQRIRNAESVTMEEIRKQEIALASRAYLKVIVAFGEKFFYNFDLVANNIANTRTAKALMITFIFFLTCSLFTKAPKYKGQTHRVRSVLMLISKIHKYEHPLVWEVLQAPDHIYEEELKTLVQILKYFEKRKFVAIPDYKLFTNWLEKCDQENVQSTDLLLMDALASHLAGSSKREQQLSGSIQFANSTPSKLPAIAAEFVEAIQSERNCNAKRIEGKLDHILSFLSLNKLDGQEPTNSVTSKQVGNSGTVEFSSNLSAVSSRNMEPFTQEEKGTMLSELFEQDNTGLDSLCASYTRKIKSEPLDASDPQDYFQPRSEASVGDGLPLPTNLLTVKEEPRENFYSEQSTFDPFTTVESVQPTESMFYSEFEEEPTTLKTEVLDFK